MKVKSLFTACLFMLAVGAQAASDARAILHHDNKPVAIYEADKLNDAISAAVAGDTIYLSAGAFPAFTLTKAITIKGAGPTTDIAGGVTINIPDNPTITAALLDAVEVIGGVTVNSDIINFTIKSVKCTVMTFNNTCQNALVDRCCIETFYIAEKMTDFYVRNSYIGKVSSTSLVYNKCTFVNCNIDEGKWETTAGRFINCMIYRANGIKSSILSYCHMNSNYIKIDSSSYTEKCYNSYHNGFPTVEHCNANGWMGNDGTPVGMDGGKTPYTLLPAGPKETASSVKVDDKEKKLNVTITVSPK